MARSRTIHSARLAAITGLVAWLLVSTGPAEARKPAPEPPPSADTGVVYVTLDGDLVEMSPDGTGRTELSTDGAGEPSRERHGTADERWFLQIRPVEGNAYPSGKARHELFAVSETGTAVQLTDAPSLEPNRYTSEWWAAARWAVDGTVVDGKVSYLAKEWARDENGNWARDADGEYILQDWGLYVLPVEPDDLTNHEAVTPDRVDVEFDLWTDGYPLGGSLSPDVDWSPDGMAIVYRRLDLNAGIWRADWDADTGEWAAEWIGGDGRSPRWSPAVDRIVLLDWSTGGIAVMEPDGSERTTIISAPSSTKTTTTSVRTPFWSPHGTHILYSFNQVNRKNATFVNDVYRAAADGTGVTNLTGDTGADAVPVGWTAD